MQYSSLASLVRLVAALGGLCVLSAPGVAGAQRVLQGPDQLVAPEEITTTGRGEARLTVDRGDLLLVVESRAPLASTAAADHARRVQAVLEALRAAGVARARLSTSGFGIASGQWYNQRAGIDSSGYVARTIVRVELGDVNEPRGADEVSRIIAVALRAGATGIESVQLYASNVAEAREQAITAAVAAACRDALSVTRAAGRALGPMLGALISDQGFPYRGAMGDPRRPTPAGFPVPVEGNVSMLAVAVTTRWHLLAPGMSDAPTRCADAGDSTPARR